MVMHRPGQRRELYFMILSRYRALCKKSVAIVVRPTGGTLERSAPCGLGQEAAAPGREG